MGCEKYAYYHTKLYYKDFFFSKNADYRDECEYRLLILKENDSIDYIGIEKTIMGIIVGDNMPDIYLQIIRKFSESYHVNCRKLYWSSWEPYLLLCKDEKD